MSESTTQNPILFYDGECGFCNGSIRFVLRHDSVGMLNFAPVQGETAAKILPGAGLPPDIGAKSIILFDSQTCLVRFRAARRVMYLMGGRWRLLSKILAIIPSPLGDIGYRIIANSRKHLPSGNDCALLPPDQRRRFLP